MHNTVKIELYLNRYLSAPTRAWGHVKYPNRNDKSLFQIFRRKPAALAALLWKSRCDVGRGNEESPAKDLSHATETWKQFSAPFRRGSPNLRHAPWELQFCCLNALSRWPGSFLKLPKSFLKTLEVAVEQTSRAGWKTSRCILLTRFSPHTHVRFLQHRN